MSSTKHAFVAHRFAQMHEAARAQAQRYHGPMGKSRTARAAQDKDVVHASAARLLRRLRLVANAVKAHLREVESQAGVGGAQVWALSVVQASPGISVGELARALDVHQSTASNLVRALAQRKLVEPRRSEPDRRGVQLHLLPAGARVLRKAPAPFTGTLPHALASLAPTTLQRLDRDLATLAQALGLPAGQADVG